MLLAGLPKSHTHMKIPAAYFQSHFQTMCFQTMRRSPDVKLTKNNFTLLLVNQSQCRIKHLSDPLIFKSECVYGVCTPNGATSQLLIPGPRWHVQRIRLTRLQRSKHDVAT